MKYKKPHVKLACMATPIGLCSASTYAAFKANVDNKHELHFHDNAGDSLIGSYLDLGQTRTRRFRIINYMRALLSELAEEISLAEMQRTPIILLLPEALPLTPEALSEALAASSENDSIAASFENYLYPPVTINPKFIRCVHGHATDGVRALELAASVLEKGDYQAVFLCACDSLINATSLQSLDTHHRLMTTQNSDGVIVGEAAAGVLLNYKSEDALCSIEGVGFAEEPSTLYNDIPLRADGICQATRQALKTARLQMHDIDIRFSDAAGESFHFKEQVLMVTRLLRENKDRFELILPARTLGYTGCCSSLCGLSLMAMDLNHRGSPDMHALLFAGDDNENRAVVVASRVPEVHLT